MLKRKRFLIGGLIVIIAIAYLSFMGISSAAVFYYEVNEILAQAESVYGDNVRVHGLVEPGSISAENQNTLIRFTIIDAEGEGSLPVVYRGVVPDTFKEDSDVVVEGVLGTAGVFEADLLLAKCPSKYEPDDGNRGY